MQEQNLYSKAENIRDVIRYLRRFKNASIVIYMDDRVIDSPLFTSHIRDICMIHAAGLQVVIVPGARKRIDEVLASANIPWRLENGCRITGEDAMPLIKMAAFDVSNRIMTSLAGERQTAVIGNWVRARGKGVRDGTDFATSGEIDKVQTDAIRTVLENRFIPIFPCIGWSAAGKPYNISSVRLAAEVAERIQADKLFFLLPDAELTASRFSIPDQIGLSPEGHIPALNLEEAELFLQRNPLQSDADDKTIRNESLIRDLIELGTQACRSGVSRVHILNSNLDGTVPCEIFSDLGSGTMIYESDYGGIRDMSIEDIPAVLNLIRPFVEKGILLPRTESSLAARYADYIVYELDGGIRACAALHSYADGQKEIAAVAVDQTCAHLGIGPKLVEYLIARAKKQKARSVFILTTQTADWFEALGFRPAPIETLPEKRKETWSPARGSKLYRKSF
ncbi:amino-acid N-acetyltransferase [Treponema brennaborense]|uniref:amino-acid N-acetyltransferase n=1 Tax=Treponema brennaborense (strain DSM 12168 / CIP 105900 / DD5/3) TaxID=906968 RepID=F4LP12_TREBD|nr:amino-acid N-acetyltransferase [Treponema brennaborense]AEE17989.1 amino-acid N-acetyltransferase [Treponema brennaborense DSM 12168]